jgi:hypothetical protein
MSSGYNLDKKHPLAGNFCPLHGLVNKGLELLHPIQNSLQLHPGFFSRIGFACPQYQLQDLIQDALPESFQRPSGVANKSSYCFHSLFLSSERKKNSIGPVEMWESPTAFWRGFSTFP